MGASRAVHRLNTPAALALVLALAGSTSPGSSPGTAVLAGARVDGQSVTTQAQVTASTTVVDAGLVQVLDPAAAFEPAVRIAATDVPADGPVQVDIADVLLDAYRSAVAGAPVACHLPVSLLAAIGQVESGSLAGRPVDAQHRTSVLGPVLDGHGFAAIHDTDQGRWDGDATWDRAVGPMQFIPGTWRSFGVDGDGDGVADPQDVEDAAAGAAAYLCNGARDLARPADMRAAILSYNHSDAYLRLVMTYQQRFAGLGLDDPTATGLPTSISLIATAVPEPGTWKAAQVVARENAKARADRAKAGAPAGSAKAAVGSRPKAQKTAESARTPDATTPDPTTSPTPTTPSGTPTPSETPTPTPSPTTTQTPEPELPECPVVVEETAPGGSEPSASQSGAPCRPCLPPGTVLPPGSPPELSTLPACTEPDTTDSTVTAQTAAASPSSAP
jgi:hypothetical protein